jgi:hypothetical protein
MIRIHIRSWATGRNTLYSFQSDSFIVDSRFPSRLVQALSIAAPTETKATTFNCASLEPRAKIKTISANHRNKISINPPLRVFLSIFFDRLPSFVLAVRVEDMKTSHTLIQRRQHRSLCLVSARLPG